MDTKEQAKLLCDAAHFGRHDELLELLGRGAIPNIRDVDGWTPLHRAARSGNTACALALCRAGAEPSDPLGNFFYGQACSVEIALWNGRADTALELASIDPALGADPARSRRLAAIAKEHARMGRFQGHASDLGELIAARQLRRELDDDVQETPRKAKSARF